MAPGIGPVEQHSARSIASRDAKRRVIGKALVRAIVNCGQRWIEVSERIRQNCLFHFISDSETAIENLIRVFAKECPRRNHIIVIRTCRRVGSRLAAFTVNYELNNLST